MLREIIMSITASQLKANQIRNILLDFVLRIYQESYELMLDYVSQVNKFTEKVTSYIHSISDYTNFKFYRCISVKTTYKLG